MFQGDENMCPVCTEKNCTYQKCKDMIKDREKPRESMPPVDEIIKELWP